MLLRQFWYSLAVLLFVLAPALPTAAAVTLVRDGNHYVLENDFIRLRVTLAKGGLVDSYVVKATGRELIGEGGFLLGDHFWQQLWPGEFLGAPYDAKILATTPDAATLEVSCVSKGWQEKTSQNDLRVSRRLTLRADSPVLLVEVGVENVGKTGRLAGYWSQNICYAGGRKEEKQLYFRPSLRAVSDATYESRGNKWTFEYGTDFVRDPQQGWMAALGAESQSGLAFVMRYDELMFLYNCFSFFTNEWQYTTAAIPAGKTWHTDFVIYPLDGLPRVDYASRRLAVAVEPTDADGKLTVRLHLLAAGAPLADVSVESGMVEARKAGQPVTPFPNQQLPRVGGAPAVLTFTLPHDPYEPLALRFTVRGKLAGEAFTESFETWYGGKFGLNRQVDGSPLYVIPAPERHVTMLKPDKIEKTHNAVPHVLFCKGIYADKYLPPALFAALRAEVTPSYFKPAGTFPATISDFPGSYEDLMELDVIALLNIDAAALGNVGQEMVKDFVTHGGTLLYGGDLWAYQHGNLGTGQLADLLPVTLADATASGPPTYLRDEPVYRCAADGQPAAPLAKTGVWLYRTNTFAPKPGAQVLLAGKSGPVVVTWKVGEGRVIAITGTALGEAPAGMTLFTQTPEWGNFFVDLLK